VDFDLTETIRELENEMLEAANNLEFEKAALLRDQIKELKRMYGGESKTTQSQTSKPYPDKKPLKKTTSPSKNRVKTKKA
jgi:excinuclease ABC subunit B